MLEIPHPSSIDVNFRWKHRLIESTTGDITDKSKQSETKSKKASESTKCICLFRSDRD
jgi:hypothetical protein